MLEKNKIILTVDDEKGRPLIILRSDSKSRLMYIFKRYIDMSEEAKEIIRTAYQISIENKNQGIENIEDFLSFSENQPCG
jgi:hypothetical protein